MRTVAKFKNNTEAVTITKGNHRTETEEIRKLLLRPKIPKIGRGEEAHAGKLISQMEIRCLHMEHRYYRE
jgi:hypothetical protein